MGMQVTVHGLDRLERRLKGLQGAPLHRVARRGLVRGGRKVVPRLKANAPKGRTLNLSSAMSSRQGRHGIAAVVGPRGRKAAHRHLVARGTKPHMIRARAGGALRFGSALRASVRHPGSRPNDYVTRSWNEGRTAALQETARYIVTESAK